MGKYMRLHTLISYVLLCEVHKILFYNTTATYSLICAWVPTLFDVGGGV